jgi:DNA invertase Pin-like site-specific DNA recombinase
MIAVMAGISQFERELIKARCDAGIARARARTTKFGRPRTLSEEQKIDAAKRYADGVTLTALAAEYKTSIATMSRAPR